MAEMTFNDVLQAVRKLSPQQKALLIAELEDEIEPVTRESILTEFERRKAAGLFKNVESLGGKYAVPGLEISIEELRALRTKLSTDWEIELDEFDGDTN